jgi:hypothetical protein
MDQVCGSRTRGPNTANTNATIGQGRQQFHLAVTLTTNFSEAEAFLKFSTCHKILRFDVKISYTFTQPLKINFSAARDGSGARFRHPSPEQSKTAVRVQS